MCVFISIISYASGTVTERLMPIFTFYLAPGNTIYTMIPGEEWGVGVFALEDDTINSSFKT